MICRNPFGKVGGHHHKPHRFPRTKRITVATEVLLLGGMLQIDTDCRMWRAFQPKIEGENMASKLV